MLSKIFDKNKVLKSMEYSGGDLRIYFNKGQVRIYSQVPPPIAYGLFYKTNATDTLQYYSTQIKKKFKVIQVINQ